MADIVACTAEHPLPGGRVRLLGAVESVTGAMTEVELGGCKLLVDCGIAQGREASRWRFPDAAREAHAVILTHGHHDHIGALPQLLAGDWQGPVVGTAATLGLARLSLEDSLEMQRVPRGDVRDFLRRFDSLALPVHYDRPARLAGFDGTVAFREAGHIIGSASVEIRAPGGRVILSGDLGRPDAPILRDPNTTWDGDAPVDLVVVENTYGDREHTHDHASIEAELGRVVREAVARGGKVFVPSFAIGRTQTLLWFLDRLGRAGKIPEVPVALDTPLGLSITELYDGHRALFDRESLGRLANGDDPLDFEQLFAVKRGRDSARVRAYEGPMVVIAGSGMCVGGRILGHLREGLPDPRNTVLFVGHQAEGTLGRRIQRAAPDGDTVRIDDEAVPVRARVETLRGLSAHADRRELVDWLRCIPGLRRVALHHGEADAQRAFATWAHDRLSAPPRA